MRVLWANVKLAFESSKVKILPAMFVAASNLKSACSMPPRLMLTPDKRHFVIDVSALDYGYNVCRSTSIT